MQFSSMATYPLSRAMHHAFDCESSSQVLDLMHSRAIWPLAENRPEDQPDLVIKAHLKAQG